MLLALPRGDTHGPSSEFPGLNPGGLLPVKQISALPSSGAIPLAPSTEQTAQSCPRNVFSLHLGWEKPLKPVFEGWQLGLEKLLSYKTLKSELL